MKVINPNGTGGYKLHLLDSEEEFNSVQAVEKCIVSSCQEYAEKDKVLHFGYILPGHGKKGKEIQLTSNDDLCEVYPRFRKGTEIVLWMKRTIDTTRKRSRTMTDQSQELEHTHTSSESDSSHRSKAGRSNYDKHIEKMTTVDEICDKLSTEHGDKYTSEQYSCWASLIQLRKHDYYDSPPKKTLLHREKGDGVACDGISPSKRINTCSECISQLNKWHSLKERGIISEEQYKEVQDKIMSDINQLFG